MESASPRQRAKGCKAVGDHKGAPARQSQRQQAAQDKQDGASASGCDDEGAREAPLGAGGRSTGKPAPCPAAGARHGSRSSAGARSRSSAPTTRPGEPMSYSRALSAGERVEPDASPPPQHSSPSGPPGAEAMSYSRAVSSSSSSSKTPTTTTTTTTRTRTEPVTPCRTGPAEPTYSSVVSGGLGAIERARPKGPDNAGAQQRHAVLSYEQVLRLNDVMDEVVGIHGRGNFPTLEVRLRDLVTLVRRKLEEPSGEPGDEEACRVRDVRLNGGAASHVLASERQAYNDLDLIYGVRLEAGRDYERVKQAVLGALFELLPEGVSRARITACSLKEAYVSKMVKVQSGDGSDRWSLISLGSARGQRQVELKFVHAMRRQFEFSVDSFQIVLDSLLRFHESSRLPMTESVYPTVVGESVYGDFHEALYHLRHKLISTRHPEEIRGGGLLKYCNLLAKAYRPAQPDYIKGLERYMCSRFFIDFPDIGQQRAKLESYLANHFVGPDEQCLRYQYLGLLHAVVEQSTVCLMGHERRQTLALIESLAYQELAYREQQPQQPTATTQPAAQTAYVYANGYYYATSVVPAAACQTAASCYACTCSSHWMAACSS